MATPTLCCMFPSSFYSASSDLFTINDGDDLAQMEQRYAELSVPVDILFGCEDVVLNRTRHGDVLSRLTSQVTLKVVSGGYSIRRIPMTSSETWAARG
ncbi:MAG TPA: hypothetical protein VIH96_00750, partial [Paraburkholderia sp.]